MTITIGVLITAIVLLSITVIVLFNLLAGTQRSFSIMSNMMRPKPGVYETHLVELIAKLLENNHVTYLTNIFYLDELEDIRLPVMVKTGLKICPECMKHVILLSSEMCTRCRVQMNNDRKILDKMVKEGVLKEVNHEKSRHDRTAALGICVWP